MKNIIEVAAWMYIGKTVAPIIVGAAFALGIVAKRFMDKATETEYRGTKLSISRRR
jgi:hypothetical protein